MRRNSSRTAIAAAGWCLSLGSSLNAQTVATLDVGASVVEYDGFLVSGAAVASPAVRYDAVDLSIGAQGTWVVFESGNQILQGTAAAAWRNRLSGPWLVELSGSMGVSQYETARGSGHVLARVRLHVQEARRGAWLGGATGQSFGDTTATPLELAAGAWTSRLPIALGGTVTGTWIAGEGYADLVTAARWSRDNVELDGQAGLRIDGAEVQPYSELSGLVTLNDRLTLALSAGRSPPDPVRGIIAATHVTLGLRIDLARGGVPVVPTIAGAMERAAGELERSDYGSTARIEIEPGAGETPRTITVYSRGAQSVELMGDFTDWQPVTLTPTEPGIWQIRLTLTPGIHRLNLRVDGGPWRVPRGTRLVETEFGDAVGVVVIP